MSNIVPFPDSKTSIHTSFFLPSTRVLIPHRVLVSWPEAGLVAGCKCLVRPGRTSPGQLIAFYYYGRLIFSFLHYQDVIGNIAVRGSDGQIVRLRKDQYKIEGEVVVSCASVKVAPPAVYSHTLLTNGKVLPWRANSKGRNVEASIDWTIFTGQSPEEAKEEGWLRTIHPDDRERVVNSSARAMITQTPFQHLCRIRDAEGIYHKTISSAIPIFSPLGEILSWSGITQFQ